MITKEEYRARVLAFARELLRNEIEQEILRQAAFEREMEEAAEADIGDIFGEDSMSSGVVCVRSSRVVTVEEFHALPEEPLPEPLPEEPEGAKENIKEATEAAPAVKDTAGAAAAPPPPRREAAIRAEVPEQEKVREKLSPEERQLRRRLYMRAYAKEYYRLHREELREYYRRRYLNKKAGK